MASSAWFCNPPNRKGVASSIAGTQELLTFSLACRNEWDTSADKARLTFHNIEANSYPLSSSSTLVTHSGCHLFQRLQLLAVHKVELCHKVVKVLVTGVDMRLRSHDNDTVKVVYINMDEDPEESAEDLLADLKEVLWKGNPNTCRKYVFIVDLYLNPVHQKAHILRRWQGCGLLVLQVILPPVLVFRTTRHHRAGPFRAKFTDGSIDEVDSVEKVDHVYGHPVIKIFSIWELHRGLQIHTTCQRRLSPLVKFKPLGSRLKFAFGSKGFVLVKNLLQSY